MSKTDNEKYVKRGKDLYITYDPEWDDDVMNANLNKVGAPFRYSDRLIMLSAAFKNAFHVGYRQVEGMVDMMLGPDHKAPHYSVIARRVAKLDVDEGKGDIMMVFDKKKRIVMAIDATGLKQHNRGEWIREKWKVKRGFLKVHALVDVDTKKIIAASITADSVGDSTMFASLFKQSMGMTEGEQEAVEGEQEAVEGEQEAVEGEQEAVEGEQGTRRELVYENRLASGIAPFARLPPHGSSRRDPSPILLGDAAYGSRKNIALCAESGVIPGILHKKNVTARGKGSGDQWGESVRDQFAGGRNIPHMDKMDADEKAENRAYWKARIGYGSRWIVECVFSAFKRLFGEHLYSLKWENMVQEVKLKVALYNKWCDDALARESGHVT